MHGTLTTEGFDVSHVRRSRFKSSRYEVFIPSGEFQRCNVHLELLGRPTFAYCDSSRNLRMTECEIMAQFLFLTRNAEISIFVESFQISLKYSIRCNKTFPPYVMDFCPTSHTVASFDFKRDLARPESSSRNGHCQPMGGVI